MFKRNTFATRLKMLREERGMNQNELAKDLGVSRGSISFYENGSRLPDIDVVYRICSFFGVTSDYLIGLTNNQNKANMEIGRRLGLTDSTISILEHNRNKVSYTSILNYLINEGKFFHYLRNYLLVFVTSQIRKTDYRLIPLKTQPLAYWGDISFSAVIRILPKLNEKVEKEFMENSDLMNSLMLEYLENNADIIQCKRDLSEWNQINEYGEIIENEILDDAFDYSYYLEEVEKDSYESVIEDEADAAEYQEYLIKKFDAIIDFMEFLKKKEGALNGNDPETRE